MTPNKASRLPGSFSPIVQPPLDSRSNFYQIETSNPDDSAGQKNQIPQLSPKTSLSSTPAASVQVHGPRPLYTLSQGNSSSSSLQNYNISRPSSHSGTTRPEPASRHIPTVVGTTSKSSTGEFARNGRLHSSTQGSFEAYLPTAANGNLSSMVNSNTGLTASQIAAQAAMQHQTHMRQRSQTAPTPQIDNANRRPSIRGPSNPPMLSLTEASGPCESGLEGQIFKDNLGETTGNVAQTAANVVFSKPSISSPSHLPSEYLAEREREKEKPAKSEKSKVKLFSRPGKGTNSKEKEKETKVGALPSPNKMAFTSLQRGNFSNISINDNQSSSSSIYSLANSSLATIRPLEVEEKKMEKEKDKPKHHFLSRQKHKLTSKDDHNLPLSSAASNSKPVDPNAPTSLYNFNLPLSPSASTTSFAKSMSGLDLRHGGRALREKKKDKEEKFESSLREAEGFHQANQGEWPGPSSLGSGGGATSFLAASSINYASSICGYDASAEIVKNGLDRLGAEDAWPFLRTKLLAVFEGEDIRLPVEDFNRILMLHIQSTHRKRCSTKVLIDELQDLSHSGFSLLEQNLRRTPEERLISQLVDVWLFTFTVVLPFMQAVFLPLDLELSNNPTISHEDSSDQGLDNVRSVVLRSFRDTIILSRFETLKNLFSRLSLENISCSTSEQNNPSGSAEFPIRRPSTAISLEPSSASYSSQATTLLDSMLQTGRNRALSNVSTHLSAELPGLNNYSGFRARERERDNDRTVEDSGRLLTETVGRMLQCVGVLNSVYGGNNMSNDSAEIEAKMGELVRCFKLNWLGRGRTGRNRKGLVGAKARAPVLGLAAAIEA